MSTKRKKKKAQVFAIYAKSITLILGGITGLILAIAELIKWL